MSIHLCAGLFVLAEIHCQLFGLPSFEQEVDLGKSTPGYWRGEFSRWSNLRFRRNNVVFVRAAEHWTSSIPSAGCSRVHGNLPNQSTCVCVCGHLFRMPPGRLPQEVFLACPAGRDPEEDPGHAGATMSPSWPGNALGSSRKSWRKCPVRRKSGCPCSGTCPRNPAPDKRTIMDGWWICWHQSTKSLISSL